MQVTIRRCREFDEPDDVEGFVLEVTGSEDPHEIVDTYLEVRTKLLDEINPTKEREIEPMEEN